MKGLRLIVSHNHESSGYVLLEILISLAVLILISITLVSVVNFSVTVVAVSRQKSLSIQYAQEGVELAQSLRTLDWDGIASNCCSSDGTEILGTPFIRTITVQDVSANEKEIEVLVNWDADGRQYETAIVTVMTNY